MDEKHTTGEAVTPEPASTPYEAPRVESVLTADDLTREVQYAGAPSQFDGIPG